MTDFDVLVVGGGPAGLSAGLALGRGRRRALLCDGGEPRNARATHVHGFLTRDGTPPAELRALGRRDLEPYPNVEVRNALVDSIEGEAGAFVARVAGNTVTARLVLLTTGMIDRPPPIPGYRELWGHAIFQCPYCHGWEVRDRPFGLHVTALPFLEWSIFLSVWSRDLVAFTDASFEVPADVRARVEAAGIRIEERKITRLHGDGERLAAIEVEGGEKIPRDVLFARPPQEHTPIVRSLGLDLDEQGYVKTTELRQTSRPGIYAAGDLTTQAQGAIVGAAAGYMAAAMLSHALVAMPPASSHGGGGRAG